MKKITELERTCSACTSQWEGKLEDGSHIYIRFRGGSFSYGVGPTHKEAVQNSRLSKHQQISDPYDGDMSDEQMISLMAGYGFVVTADAVLPRTSSRAGVLE